MSETPPSHTFARPKTVGLLGGLALVGTIAGVTLTTHASAADQGTASPVPAATGGPATPLPPVLAADDAGRQRAVDQFVYANTVKFNQTAAWNKAVQRVAQQRAATAVAEAAEAARARQEQYAQNQAYAASEAARQQEDVQPTSYSSGSDSGSAASGSVEATLACIRAHESGGNYGAVNSSSGAGGAYQFMPSTWSALGGTGSPSDASASEQNAVALHAYEADGWSPWAGDGCV